MTAEAPEKGTGYAPSERKLLETFLLMALEKHDGLCLDNQPERTALSTALTTALVSAVKDGTIDFVRLLEPPQTTDSSSLMPLPE